MQCLYCDSHIHPYPADGICPNCGARLPADNAPAWQSVPPRPQAPVSRPVIPLQPGINCCPACRSQHFTARKRGFNWLLAILGLLLLPPFGILFGLIGKNKLLYACQVCRHKWKR